MFDSDISEAMIRRLYNQNGMEDVIANPWDEGCDIQNCKNSSMVVLHFMDKDIHSCIEHVYLHIQILTAKDSVN